MSPKTKVLGITLSCAIYAAIIVLLVRSCHAATQHPAIIFETSGSMAPAIGVHDVLIADYCPLSACHAGDIVMFHSQLCQLPVTHRLVRQVQGFPGCWITKGDANPREDRGYVSGKNFILRIGYISHR